MRERDMTHFSIQFESQTLCSYSNQLSPFAADAAAQVPIEHEHAISWIMSGIQYPRQRVIDLLQGCYSRLIASEEPALEKWLAHGIACFAVRRSDFRHENGRLPEFR